MGMEASYRRLTPIEFDYLMQHPEVEADFFDIDVIELARSEHYLSIEKNWDGLHYLLTGQRFFLNGKHVEPPLRNVVIGGTATPYECSYGFVRYLVPDEVRAVADLLQSLNEDELRAGFWRNLPQAGEVYAFGGDELELTILMRTFAEVRQFFSQAAHAGDVMLLSSD